MKKNARVFSWFSWVFIFLIGLLILLLFLSPAEKSLSWIVKLVYVHVGLVWSSLILFALSFFLVLLSFFKREILFWARGGVLTAYIFWWLYFFSSLLVAYLAWGGVNWAEPRLRIALEVLVFSSIFLLLAFNLENESWQRVFYFLTSLGTWALWLTRTSILHPNQPIRRSSSIALKAFAFSIFLDILILSIVTMICFSLKSRYESR
jgi:hypothetical protein